MKRLLKSAVMAVIALLLVGTPDFAPAASSAGIEQSGVVTPGHALKVITSGVAGDAGGAAGGPPGTGLTELGITNSGIGFCQNSGPTTLPYLALCLGYVGGIPTISENAYGGATQQGFNLNLNGTTYPFPGNGTGNVLAPTAPAALAGEMVLWNANGSGATKNGGLPPLMASTFSGVDVTGATDSTTGLQNCLNAAGAGGTCEIDRGATLEVLGNLTIPANTTLQCGFSFSDSEDGANIAAYATEPSIHLAATATIGAGGPSASVRHCLVLRNGMIFPVTNASVSYAGLAFSDNGYGAFTMTGDECIGFDSCFYGTGTRPYFRHDYFDCNGVTHACLDEENDNTDSGYFEDIKLQPLGSGNYGGSVTCTEATRTGVGFLIKGINFVDNLVSQNFLAAEIRVGAPIAGGVLWTDFPEACEAGNTPRGIDLIANGSLWFHALNINGTNDGIFDESGGGFDQVGQIFFNLVANDCMVLGTGTTAAGRWQVGSITTNTGNTTLNCGRYAVNYDDNSGNGSLSIGSAIFQGVNGNSAPYFDNTSATTPTLGHQLNIHDLFTNLPLGTNPYSGFEAGSGSEAMLVGIKPTLSCTGIGTGGSCVFSVNSDLTRGAIKITTGTTPPNDGSSSIVLSMSSVNAANGLWLCTWSFDDTGGSAWPVGETDRTIEASPSLTQMNWEGTGTLTAAAVYSVVYHCLPN